MTHQLDKTKIISTKDLLNKDVFRTDTNTDVNRMRAICPPQKHLVTSRNVQTRLMSEQKILFHAWKQSVCSTEDKVKQSFLTLT